PPYCLFIITVPDELSPSLSRFEDPTGSLVSCIKPLDPQERASPSKAGLLRIPNGIPRGGQVGGLNPLWSPLVFGGGVFCPPVVTKSICPSIIWQWANHMYWLRYPNYGHIGFGTESIGSHNGSYTLAGDLILGAPKALGPSTLAEIPYGEASRLNGRAITYHGSHSDATLVLATKQMATAISRMSRILQVIPYDMVLVNHRIPLGIGHVSPIISDRLQLSKPIIELMLHIYDTQLIWSIILRRLNWGLQANSPVDWRSFDSGIVYQSLPNRVWLCGLGGNGEWYLNCRTPQPPTPDQPQYYNYTKTNSRGIRKVLQDAEYPISHTGYIMMAPRIYCAKPVYYKWSLSKGGKNPHTPITSNPYSESNGSHPCSCPSKKHKLVLEEPPVTPVHLVEGP
ncbi:hypothetical protein G9A89_000498, partial [Geosiphon pyriformis]